MRRCAGGPLVTPEGLLVRCVSFLGNLPSATFHQLHAPCLEQRIIDFGRGYGNKRRSIVPMNDAVYEALLEAKELAQTDHVVEYNGRPTRAIKKAFSRLCESCGIKASPHVLRHTAATWLVMDGVPLSEVARLLGDSEKTVETVYGKHSPDYLRRAVTALNLTKNKPVLQL
ncbi:MAG: tyrosine-type recombinase/integrase [Alphaproteobacteria bacterium]|nr:tyrosine-type recombinase/integrase [Alphaproteobacteria bacterium]